MKINFYKLSLIIAFIGLFFTGCSEDNTPLDDNNGEGGTETPIDYTATTDVKTVVLENEAISGTDKSGFNTKRNKIIYEDFNCCYDLLYSTFCGIVIAPYQRANGKWKCNMNMYGHTMYAMTGYLSDIKLMSVGKVDGISNITTKDIQAQGSYSDCSVEVQPQYGYAGYFLTEDGEKKFIRIWVKDYYLDTQGMLYSVTVEYQLY